ncbi:FRG domain-containing protein [Paraburkholderia unamae]|uniref:FRG domain-containing protein n=1 Tax=Paraburkholderia unamae TaxID=219649 RepID=A0ACC6RWT9_9BURK
MTHTSSKRALQDLGEVKSVTDFLAKIYPHVNGKSNYLFRGHRRSDWALKPAIARSGSSAALEAEMLDEFKRRALPYIEAGSTLSDADWLAIAQHHGMPTRLLDWSGSALAALWFAVRKAPADGQFGAVWILRYEDAGDTDFADEGERNEPFRVRETRLIPPRHVTRRITAQEGWFSLHRRAEPGSSPAFVSLETNQRFSERLYFVTIPSDAFGPIRVQLGMAGIGAAVLFPDLDGIAQHVTWIYQSPDDELRTRVGWPRD